MALSSRRSDFDLNKTVWTGTSADRLALVVADLEKGAQFDQDDGNSYKLYGSSWYQIETTGLQMVADQSIGAIRNPLSTTESYLPVREECNLTICDGTGAVTIGGGVANDTHLMSITIPHGVAAITATIAGFEDSAGNATNIVITGNATATDPSDRTVDFKGAINSKGALTVTDSVGDKVIVLWKAV